MHFYFIFFFHATTIFSTIFSRIVLFPISELINIIASNYLLVDDNFISSIILVQVTSFRIHFKLIKFSLSSINHAILSLFHFILIILIIDDSWRYEILMRDRCIKCGDLRSFFSPPSMEPLALSFGFVSLTTICDFFLLMVFIFYVV